MSNLCLASQSDVMLKWFFKSGVSSVDIHLRSPKFKGAVYSSNDWIWLTQHADRSLEQAQKLMKWCRYKNTEGSDIFIRPHRYTDQPIIFLDDLSLLKANKVSSKYRSFVIETSHNNTQVWVSLTEKLNEENRKNLQQAISNLNYTDKGSVSGEHLGRLCGFKSQKRDFWVSFVRESSFKKLKPMIEETISSRRRGACAKSMLGKKTQSEIDFSWALMCLRQKISSEEIINKLTQSAKVRGKPAPRKYAIRTVRRSMEILT